MHRIKHFLPPLAFVLFAVLYLTHQLDLKHAFIVSSAAWLLYVIRDLWVAHREHDEAHERTMKSWVSRRKNKKQVTIVPDERHTYEGPNPEDYGEFKTHPEDPHRPWKDE